MRGVGLIVGFFTPQDAVLLASLSVQQPQMHWRRHTQFETSPGNARRRQSDLWPGGQRYIYTAGRKQMGPMLQSVYFHRFRFQQKKIGVRSCICADVSVHRFWPSMTMFD